MGHLQRRLIAFDLDGTLVDSRQDLADAANQLIVELGGEGLPLDAITSMVGGGAALLVERALTAAGLSFSPGALIRFLSIYDERLLATTRLYPGVEALLTTARTLGHVAVLTNKPHAPSERILEGLGVKALVDTVVGGDGPYPRKPAPEGFAALMTLAGSAPASSLLVGDSGIDLETARRAGASCCLVSYGFSSPAREGLLAGEWLVDSAESAIDVLHAFAAGRRA